MVATPAPCADRMAGVGSSTKETTRRLAPLALRMARSARASPGTATIDWGIHAFGYACELRQMSGECDPRGDRYTSWKPGRDGRTPGGSNTYRTPAASRNGESTSV